MERRTCPLLPFQCLLLATWLLLPGCPKNPSAFVPEWGGASPAIAGFHPAQAAFGATLVIEGSHFGANAADNVVKLNAVEAVVTLATPTRLEVTVPKDKACGGQITVTVGGKTATSAAPFGYVPTVTVSTFVDVAGPGSEAGFSQPQGIAVDKAGNLYVADTRNNRICKRTPEGKISTFAGSTQGFADGPGNRAKFDWPEGITLDAAGNLYVADRFNNRIRKVTPEGEVSTLAGFDGHLGYADGPGSTAEFQWPSGIAMDKAGNLYVADEGNERIRKITPEGEVSTLAGSTDEHGNGGFADGPGSAAKFNLPSDIAVDTAGNLYVVDQWNHRIRKVTPEGEVSTLAGSGEQGTADGKGSAAQFRVPRGITLDAEGNLYVIDNHHIRKVTLEGEVSLLAGGAAWNDWGLVDGPGSVARFDSPSNLTLDAEGNLYVLERSGRIRKLTLE